ncbi:MAG TPA: DinB family protein, partial [Terracidiphilus sp.]|nr:DinB family protein [Terracidiphilus sp.]
MESQKQQILKRLREGESALNSALAGIDPESAVRKPAPGRWSIVDIVEHLAASEAILLDRLRQAAPSAISHADPAREAHLEALALNRERRIDAPEPALPTGACATLAEALGRFRAVRTRTIQFVE